MAGYWDKGCSQWKRACALRSSLWSGYRLGERIYQLYGNPEKEKRGFQKMRSLFRRKVLNRVEILDLLEVTPASMDRFIGKMRAHPPSVLWGHTHALYLLATYMIKNGVDDIQPKGMFSAGMPMLQFERQRIEEAFHCPIQNRYGCEELGMIACECRHREGLHINTDSLYIECLDAEGRPVTNGKQGQIVITDLTNRAMPLIRYKLEDWIIMSDRQCVCGRTQPMIEKIEGRTADFLITPEGKLVSGISLTDHFAGHIPGVDQIQIIQDIVDRITLKLVVNDSFDGHSRDRITQLVEDFFGRAMAYDLEFVPSIEKDPSGKYRFSICNVKHELTQ
jgi:phenylacetate-CoA ligase